MTNRRTSTRRSFLKNGSLLAVPLAVAAPAAVIADDELKVRLAKLEDEISLRKLHQTWLRKVSAQNAESVAVLDATFTPMAPGAIVRGIAPDHTREPDAINIAADGKSASGRFHCIVETETTIPQDSTLAEMAHAQGCGFIRRTEPRILRVGYKKIGAEWAVTSAAFGAA